MDMLERYRMTKDRFYYNVLFSVIFLLSNAAIFGSLHLENVSSKFGGTAPRNVKLVVTEHSIVGWLSDSYLDLNEPLEAQLIYENQEEFFLRVPKDRIVRLPKSIVVGIEFSSDEDDN